MGNRIQVKDPDRRLSKPRRSCWLWIVAFGFGLAALSGLQRFAVSITDWFWLERAGLFPGPLYLAINAVVWAIASLFGLIAVLRGGSRSGVHGTAAALFLAAVYWVDRLLSSRGLGENAAYAALVTLLALAFVLAVLRPWQRVSPTPPVEEH